MVLKGLFGPGHLRTSFCGSRGNGGFYLGCDGAIYSALCIETTIWWHGMGTYGTLSGMLGIIRHCDVRRRTSLHGHSAWGVVSGATAYVSNTSLCS